MRSLKEAALVRKQLHNRLLREHRATLQVKFFGSPSLRAKITNSEPETLEPDVKGERMPPRCLKANFHSSVGIFELSPSIIHQEHTSDLKKQYRQYLSTV